MLANLSILQLAILLVTSISIFVFLVFLLIPGKEKKESKKVKPVIPTYERERSSLVKENDSSVLVAILSEKIDQLGRKLEDYTEVVKKIETTNLEQVKNLSKLNEMIERIGPIFSRLEINKANTGDKEAIIKLVEKMNLLEERMTKPVAEKTEMNEVKDRLNEVVTILKTLGS